MTEAIHLGTRTPARLPHAMTFEQEFLRLLDLKRRTEERLNHLVAILDPERSPVTLAASGLRLVASADNALLFKGGLTL